MIRPIAIGWASIAWIAAPGIAQAQLPHDAELDVAGGPILKSSRITAMGGAHIGIGEGAHGFMLTPAAAANPFAYNRERDFDWDAMIDWRGFGQTAVDFDNDGERDPEFDKLAVSNAGGTIAFGDWGLGIALESYKYEISARGVGGQVGQQLGGQQEVRRTTLESTTAHLGASDATDAGQLLVGLAVRTGGVKLDMTRTGPDGLALGRTQRDFQGGAFEVGVLYRPRGASWRLGATGRTPVLAIDELLDAQGHRAGDDPGYVPPARGRLPAEVAVGASWYIGPGTYNRPLPVREVEPAPPNRRHVLLAADLVLTGRTARGFSVKGFLLQQASERSGRHWSVSPRLGAEAEVWSNVLKVRVGHYLEPDRIEGSTPRPHATAGFELGLWELPWIGGRMSWGSMIDWAPRYVNLTLVGLGFWH